MRKKTERIYTPVSSMKHFCEKLADFGDKTLYRYFISKTDTTDMSYADFSALVKKEIAGLTKAGLSGKRIGIVGETSPEWVATYIAAIALGGVAIPFDKELEISELCGFMKVSETDAIVFTPCFNKHFEKLHALSPNGAILIPVDPTGCEIADRMYGDDSGDEVESDREMIPFASILSMGEKALEEGFELQDYEADDKMSVMLFTSGTTGTSKCVMLSEKNVCAAVNSACATVDFSSDDTIVSVLPIHHTYELCCMLAAMNYGMLICINDSLKHVLRNFALFKPTGLVLVPLFVNTMYKKICDEAKKKGKEKTLATALKTSKALRRVGIDLRYKLFDDVRQAFGGNLVKIICGGAALSPEYVDKFEEFGIYISEGYGITECSPLISVSPYYSPKHGSVGPSVPSCEAKIDGNAKNEKGFTEGEILVKGENVMLGYYKNEEATAAAFDADGWYRTGDIGYMDADGYIYITGRKKSVIVLNNGKNVFPEEIEDYLANIDSIEECVVVGRKKEDNDIVLTAIIYPAFAKFAKDEELEVIAEKIKSDINEINKKLPTFKQVRSIELRKTEFEKTTSRKIKRYLVK